MPSLKIVAEARSLNDAKLEKQVSHMISTLKSVCEKHGAEIEIESDRAYDAFVIEKKATHMSLQSKRHSRILVSTHLQKAPAAVAMRTISTEKALQPSTYLLAWQKYTLPKNSLRLTTW